MKTCGDYGGKTRAGNPCKNPAGFKTDHPSEFKCFVHGGCSKGRPIIHGRYAKVTSKQLHEKIKKHLEDPEPMNLLPELALLRSLLDNFIEQVEETGKPVEDSVLLSIVDKIRKTTDTIHKIQSRSLLTVAEQTYVIVTLADILKDTVQDESVLREILNRLKNKFPAIETGGIDGKNTNQGNSTLI